MTHPWKTPYPKRKKSRRRPWYKDVTWRTKRHEEVRIIDMDNNHLINSVRVLLRKQRESDEFRSSLNPELQELLADHSVKLTDQELFKAMIAEIKYRKLKI